MLRLFTSQRFYELWKCNYFVSSCVAKRQITSFLAVSSAGHHRLLTPARHFNTGVPVWKDAFQPTRDNPEEKLDLDKWKSVIKAQAATEERVCDEEEASDDDEDQEPGDELNHSSPLEATRFMVTMMRHAGRFVPQEITDEQLQELSALPTKASKKKFLKFLAIKENLKTKRKEKQQKKAEDKNAWLEKKKAAGDEGKARMFKNRMFLQFWSRSLDKVLAWRSAQAMIFGQPLVFDMSYESIMRRREMENAVEQMMETEAWNRRATEPFHLHYCNLQADGAYYNEFLKRYDAETWDRLLITSTDKRHVDVFPHEQLVYLTADSPNVLHEFDHSKVYIIGALVDRSIQRGASMANAKRLNLATARLPLDRYLQWELGGKNLTLDQMIRIMLTIKETGKWEEAFKFVPTRKVGGFHHERTPKEGTRGVANHWLRQYGDRPFRERDRNNEWTFKNESLYRPQKESEFSGRDRKTGLYTDRE
ncbi:tRNA methyltransferase 10 homolog C [Centropristis striata]|uniref:tRNA methyltransferase 10 homolog C n=1 Tax=Centropristis striata TaxID=184440 RepID=UPI0027E02EEE|nr:tRNA methyltransferase 10 homolog C [Centropristis striata]